MSDAKWTPGEWVACNMVHAETGEQMTPEEIAEYVKGCVEKGDPGRFLFISTEKRDGPSDICHIGNGPDGPANAHLIAAAPELYEALEAFVIACKEQDLKLGSIRGDAEAALAKARGQS